ncbi:MAG: NAD-dependent epimerase/dehydratase family protein [Candidatus Sulfotelmatobacter sp.]
MRFLLIGGNGFIGRCVAAQLIRQHHAVMVFHRGTMPVAAGAEEVRGDRNQLTASAPELKRFAPDVVIDLTISSASQAEELMNIFRGVTQRVVMLSSMGLYRAVGISHGTESGPLQELPLYGRVRAAAQPASLSARELADSAQNLRLGHRRLRQDSRRAGGNERPRSSRDRAAPAHGLRTRRSAASF